MEALVKLRRELGDSNLVILAYHPLNNDPFGNSQTEERKNFYGIRGFPTVIFDGYRRVEGVKGDPYMDYKKEVEDRLSEKSPVKLKSLFTLNGDTIRVTTTLIVKDSLPSGQFLLFTVVFEDSIPYKETLEQFVVRDILPEELSLKEGDTLILSYEVPLSSEWDRRHLGIVTFLQAEEVREVIQSTEGILSHPSYNFKLIVPETLKTVKVDSEALFNFTLENTGSLGDSLVVDIQPDTFPEDWFFSLCSGSVCYPLPHTLWLEQGASLSSLHVSITPESKGRGSVILLVRSISDSSLSHSQRLVTISQ